MGRARRKKNKKKHKKEEKHRSPRNERRERRDRRDHYDDNEHELGRGAYNDESVEDTDLGVDIDRDERRYHPIYVQDSGLYGFSNSSERIPRRSLSDDVEETVTATDCKNLFLGTKRNFGNQIYLENR